MIRDLRRHFTTMNDEEFTKDPMYKVSGQLRKAVGQNRHELGGLRNVVSQMKRDRNKSVGLLSKKQQEFLKKQSKLLPAISMKRPSRKTSSQVIPLSHKVASLPKHSHALPKLGIFGPTNTTQFNVLPPIRSDGKAVNEESSMESEAKLKRISEYRQECSSLQESLNNAHTFASGIRVENISFGVDRHKSQMYEERILNSTYRRFLQNQRGNEDICGNYSRASNIMKDSSGYLSNSDRVTNDTNPLESSSCETENLNKQLIEKNTRRKVYDVKESKKKNYWGIVKQNLGYITAMNRESRRQYYEQLFREIRRCRYIRKPKRMNTDTGMWYESGEDSDGEQP